MTKFREFRDVPCSICDLRWVASHPPGASEAEPFATQCGKRGTPAARLISTLRMWVTYYRIAIVADDFWRISGGLPE